jgi:hypothetical protein
MLGLHTTPEIPGISVPPGRQPPAPGSQTSSPSRRCRRSLCSQPGGARLSAALAAFRRVAFTSRFPSAGLSHSLRFRFATPCEVGDILRSGCYPCRIQATSEPPGRLPPAPGSYIHRPDPLPGELCGQLGRAELSAAFAGSRSVALTLRTHPLLDVGLTTLLSIALSRCRPATCSVCTLPLPLRAGKYPLAANHPAPGSYCDKRGEALLP